MFGTCTSYQSPQSGVSQHNSSESSIGGASLLNWRKMPRCFEMSSGHLFDEYVKLAKSIPFWHSKTSATKKKSANDVEAGHWKL